MSDNVLRSAREVKQRLTDEALDSCLVQEVDLSKIGLPGATAADVTFRRVGLHDADATEAQFARAKFTECSARGARFSGSLLRGCSFFSSELIEAQFDGATMSGSSFFSCRLGNADFSGSRIQSTTFNSCELFGVRFSRSLVINSRFEAQERGNVTLDRANFENAVLVDCDMLGSNLFGANFDNALLVKVDLRNANIAQASFNGARLIDVQIDLGQLEPAERRLVEAARLDDPWRQRGFMREILGRYSDDEMMLLVEFLIRTYIIEGAEPAAASDSFAGILASLKARYDFPELEAMRLRGTTTQVRHGTQWVDIGGPLPESIRSRQDDAPPPGGEPPAPERSRGAAEGRPAPAAPAAPPLVRPTGRSKRFRKLEID